MKKQSYLKLTFYLCSLFFILTFGLKTGAALDYDMDGDNDVDGSDLAHWSINTDSIDTQKLASEFGLTHTVDPMINYDDTHSGEATYYGATGEGNCMFDATPSNLMVAAMNNHDYYGSNACGSYVRINGPDGQITVRIVDRCPECAPGDIDLSEEAFTRIADPVDGRVPITWKYVEGEVTGPVQYKFKEGSNPYWTAVQIRNHLNPVKNVEMKNENGQWEMLHREMYNYFIYDTGMGQGPYDIRLTDVFGQQVQDENIEFVEGGIVQGYCQFPSVNNR